MVDTSKKNVAMRATTRSEARRIETLQQQEDADVVVGKANHGKSGSDDSGRSKPRWLTWGCSKKRWNELVGTYGRPDFSPRLYEDAYRLHMEEAGFGNTPLPGPAQGDLRNPIHPLFQAKRFVLEDFRTEQGKRLLRNLEPALRMASMFLQSKPVKAFLRHLVFGKEVYDPSSRRTYLEHSYREDLPMANANVFRLLKRTAKSLCLVFAAIDPSKMGDPGSAQIHGVSFWKYELLGTGIFVRGDDRLLKRLDSRSDVPHFIAINNVYKDFFSQDLSQIAPSRVVQTSWHLAGTLLHELIHELNGRVRTPDNYDLPEFYYSCSDGQDSAELGWAFEEYIFNCTEMESITRPVTGSVGQWAPITQRMVGSIPVRVESSLRFPYPDLWFHQFFETQWWKDVLSKDSKDQHLAFHVPRPEFGSADWPDKNITFWVKRRAGRWKRSTIEEFEDRDQKSLSKKVRAQMAQEERTRIQNNRAHRKKRERLKAKYKKTP